MSVQTLRCATCGELVPATGTWCEACGADLGAEPTTACVACGSTGISADGYCLSCGHKQPDPRDRIELAVGRAVAVSDRGLRHKHNEDAVALGELERGVVLVVCDGVSSTAGSAEASHAAAEAAVAHLVAALGAGGDGEATALALQEATAAAQDAAEAVADSVSGAERAVALQDGPPSSTFVAAVAAERDEGLLVAVAWLGDSRAYWVDAAGTRLLTTDHELHGSLVRWVGADSGRVPPDVVSHTIATDGRLLLCTDGLWRYADPASELDLLLRRLDDAGVDDDAEMVRRLTAHALESGGHDNISVALWSRWPSPSPGGAKPERGAGPSAEHPVPNTIRER